MYTTYYVLISKTTDTSILQTNPLKKAKKKDTTITSHTTIIEYSPLHVFHNAITGVTPNLIASSHPDYPSPSAHIPLCTTEFEPVLRPPVSSFHST